MISHLSEVCLLESQLSRRCGTSVSTTYPTAWPERQVQRQRERVRYRKRQRIRERQRGGERKTGEDMYPWNLKALSQWQTKCNNVTPIPSKQFTCSYQLFKYMNEWETFSFKQFQWTSTENWCIYEKLNILALTWKYNICMIISIKVAINDRWWSKLLIKKSFDSNIQPIFTEYNILKLIWNNSK